MISTNFKGTAVYLLNDQPDWSMAVESTFAMTRDSQISLTRRETRRPYSSTLVTKLDYTATITGSNLRIYLGAMRAVNTQSIIVPFWPAIQTWPNRATAPINGGLRIGWKADWSQYAIYASTDPEPGGFVPDYFAPAIMGFLAPDSCPPIRRDALQFKVSFVESSVAAYALDPSPSGLVTVAGPLPAGYANAPKILPFIPDREGTEEITSIQVKRDQIGFQREEQVTFYPQAAERSAKNRFTLKAPGAAQMMQFFATMSGPGASFWSPSSMQCLSLSVDALAGDTVLNVADTSALAIGDCLYIFVGPTGYAKTITALDPVNNKVTIDSALGVAAPAANTVAFPLILSRLQKAELKLTWLMPGAATAEWQWGEVPAEQLLPADETLGTTIGKLNQRVVLYQFTRDLGNGTVLNYYFTSFQADILWGGNTYLHSPFQCGDITQGLNLQDDNVQITSSVSGFSFPNNPLQADLTKTAEAPLTVTITWADYDSVNVANAQTMFTGDCSAPAREGNTIKMKCRMGPSIFNSRLPTFMRGVQCSHLRGANPDASNLISVGCTGPDNIMLKANWKFTAVVTAPLSAAWPFTLNVNTLTGVGANAAAAIASGAVSDASRPFFPPGVIEWGAGANIQRRRIDGNTTAVGGALALTLHRFFSAVPNIGDVVTLYPGCDGLYTTCKAYNAGNNPTGKFGNDKNHGGQPYTPIANPSLTNITQLGTQGAKK